MAKKRTKLQKQKALVRRKSQMISVSEVRNEEKVPLTVQSTAHKTKLTTKPASDHSSAIENLIRTELPLLKDDLKRSIFTAAVIIAGLIGIYLFLRYN